MVNINTVYKTTQAILNIEERGYLAPVEFNLYAAQAQLEIFESYFFDDAHFSISRKGMSATGESNIKKILQEKIDVFSKIADATYDTTNSIFTLPSDFYRLGTVYYNDGTTTKQVPEIMKDQLQYVLASRLTAPSTTFPKYIRLENNLRVYPNTGTNAIQTGVEVHYIKQPTTPKWDYQSLGTGRNPIFRPSTMAGSTTQDFELHASEQYLLVEKILQYAGVQLKEVDIVQIAAQAEQTDMAIKKQ